MVVPGLAARTHRRPPPLPGGVISDRPQHNGSFEVPASETASLLAEIRRAREVCSADL